MRARNGVFAAAAMVVSSLASSQPFQLGRVLSTEFLTKLTRPKQNGDEIAVIHAQVGSAMIINRRAPHEAVVYLRGGGNFLWAEIAKQLPESAVSGEPIHLELRRWEIGPGSCPNLSGKTEAFLRELEQTLASPGGASATKQEVVVDASTFVIQMAVKDARLAITPEGAWDPPLQQAAGALHSTVSGCANSVEPTVEQHDF